MIVILSIIGIVALISLYDYIGTRSWQQVTSSVRNDVVFEKRNRKYGAYVIRRDYDKTLMMIMGGVMLSVGGMYAAYAGLRPDPIEAFVEPTKTTDVEIAMVLQPKKSAKMVAPEPIKQTSSEATSKFVEPEVTDKTTDEQTKTQEELDKSKAGTSDQEKKGTDPVTTTIVTTTTTPIVTITTPKAPEVFVEIDAEFPGGFPAMMKFIQDNLEYPAIGIETGAQGKCYLRFVVGDDGEISSVKVMRGIAGCPECDREAVRVIKSMPKWKPGKIRGMNVASYFDLPINFSLE
jgi:protein TonB